MKREHSPYNPYKRKAKGKEIPDGDGDTCVSLRPRAGARTREGDFAEATADPVPQLVDEAVDFCRGTESDRLIWMKICNRNVNSFLGVLMEFENDVMHHPEHRLNNLAAAFQTRLNRVLPKGGVR